MRYGDDLKRYAQKLETIYGNMSDHLAMEKNTGLTEELKLLNSLHSTLQCYKYVVKLKGISSSKPKEEDEPGVEECKRGAARSNHR